MAHVSATSAQDSYLRQIVASFFFFFLMIQTVKISYKHFAYAVRHNSPLVMQGAGALLNRIKTQAVHDRPMDRYCASLLVSHNSQSDILLCPGRWTKASHPPESERDGNVVEVVRASEINRFNEGRPSPLVLSVRNLEQLRSDCLFCSFMLLSSCMSSCSQSEILVEASREVDTSELELQDPLLPPNP